MILRQAIRAACGEKLCDNVEGIVSQYACASLTQTSFLFETGDDFTRIACDEKGWILLWSSTQMLLLDSTWKEQHRWTWPNLNSTPLCSLGHGKIYVLESGESELVDHTVHVYLYNGASEGSVTPQLPPILYPKHRESFSRAISCDGSVVQMQDIMPRIKRKRQLTLASLDGKMDIVYAENPSDFYRGDILHVTKKRRVYMGGHDWAIVDMDMNLSEEPPTVEFFKRRRNHIDRGKLVNLKWVGTPQPPPRLVVRLVVDRTEKKTSMCSNTTQSACTRRPLKLNRFLSLVSQTPQTIWLLMVSMAWCTS